MEIDILLDQLKEAGIDVRLQGEDLRISSRAGRVDPDLRQRIRIYKEEIVYHLRNSSSCLAAGSGRWDGKCAPLSFVQEDMWRFLHASRFLNAAAAFRCLGRVDVSILREAFRYFVGRHTALRTSFVEVDGIRQQLISPECDVDVEVFSAKEVAGTNTQNLLSSIVNDLAWRRFDLEKSPLIRLGLVEIDCDNYIFVIAMDHFIADGYSVDIAIVELEKLYQSFYTGTAPSLANVEMQYADFAVWQRESLSGQAYTREISFWERKLRAASPLLLKTDYPRPAEPRREKNVIVVRRHPIDTKKITALARECGTTSFVVFLTAFSILLSKWSDSREIVIMTPTAGVGRLRREFRDVVGNFHSIVHIIMNFKESITFSEALVVGHSAVVDALAHQDLHCRRLYAELPWTQRYYRVMFIGTGMSGGGEGRVQQFETGGRMISSQPFRLEMPINPSPQDLRINMSVKGDMLGATITYSPDLWEARTIVSVWEDFCDLFERLTIEPTSAI